MSNKPLIPQVSRTTFLFPEKTMAALRSIFPTSNGIKQIVKISQEDWDALPMPRPTDVLYVIPVDTP